MLGKLIKNEIKVSAHSMLGIYVAVGVTVGIMALAALSDQLWLSMLASLAMMALSLALLVVTVISILVNFNKTLYGNQGYLSFSLPVSSGALLGSKALTAVLWLAVTFVAFFAMLSGTMSYVGKVAVEYMGPDVTDMITMLINMFQTLPSKSAMILYGVNLVISVFVLCFLIISVIFFAVTLANVRPFQKKSTIWIFVFSLGSYLVLQTINAQMMIRVPLSIFADLDGVHLQRVAMIGNSSPFRFGIAGTLFYIAAALLLIYGTSVLMKKKVNIR